MYMEFLDTFYKFGYINGTLLLLFTFVVVIEIIARSNLLWKIITMDFKKNDFKNKSKKDSIKVE